MRGPVGLPCVTPSCARRGYHPIPERFLDAVADRAAIDRAIGHRIGDYLLVGTLGSGGMGSVYLGMQDAGGPVELLTAVKVLGKSQSAALLERFQGEAAALAQLRHPNIVRLMRYGEHDGRRYLVMEYVEGGRTLESEMSRGIAPEGARRVLTQTANALAAAHERGIIHRDIKPQNIMLQAVAGDPWFVRLVDFGLAKFTAEGHATRLLAGTPVYMAPEQLRQSDIGPWTDLYALAMIALQMFTGRHPYPGQTLEQVLAKKGDASHDPTQILVEANFPAPVLAFFRRALHFEPHQRYGDAGAFLQALTPLLPWIGSPSAAAAQRKTVVGDGADLPATVLADSADLAPPAAPEAASFARGESLAEPSFARPSRAPLIAAAAGAAAVVLGAGAWWLGGRDDAPPAPDDRPAVVVAVTTPAPESAAPVDPVAEAVRLLGAGERTLAVDGLVAALREAPDPDALRGRVAREAAFEPLLKDAATAERLGLPFIEVPPPPSAPAPEPPKPAVASTASRPAVRPYVPPAPKPAVVPAAPIPPAAPPSAAPKPSKPEYL